MKIAIIGTGYVGLVSGVCLASSGHEVICVDINEHIVNNLNKSVAHIYENGLPELLKIVRQSGKFSATTDLNFALEQVDTVIVAVGTPSKNGVIDLSHIIKAVGQIGEFIKNSDKFISIIIKSTVIPGTTDTIVRDEIEKSSGKKFPAFGLGMNPEFLREGEAIEDFSNPDRIVLGYEDVGTLSRLKELYSYWGVPKICVKTRTAEMIKYANNCLLAIQISAANEIANLSAAIGGIDFLEVISAVHLDKRWTPFLPDGTRISPQILQYHIPGCGFGGSCFPKDVQALRSLGRNHDIPMDMLNSVLDINDTQPFQVAKIIEKEVHSLQGKKILVLGLAFKPGTDDVRESSAIKIIESLAERGARVIAHDPIAIENFKNILGDLRESIFFAQDWVNHFDASDVIVIATNWPEYLKIAELDLNKKVVFDSRRLLNKNDLKGCTYLSIGLG
jgi:UDPglucose 6-dehydrogenase